MRWKTKTRSENDTRVRNKFLFIPRDYDGETRWLEFAKIKEEYIQCLIIDDWGLDYVYRWCETGFADREEI